jgi:hypothetical protein
MNTEIWDIGLCISMNTYTEMVYINGIPIGYSRDVTFEDIKKIIDKMRKEAKNE